MIEPKLRTDAYEQMAFVILFFFFMLHSIRLNAIPLYIFTYIYGIIGIAGSIMGD